LAVGRSSTGYTASFVTFHYLISFADTSSQPRALPHGGAGSIAGMDLSVAGANGIIFAFALWGSAQFVYALIQLIVVFRYQSLVPLMYVLLILETLLREFVGHTRPVTFAHTPPGEIGNYIFLPLAVFMLGLSLWSARRQMKNEPTTGRPSNNARSGLNK
jgi:hypothetical protein